MNKPRDAAPLMTFFDAISIDPNLSPVFRRLFADPRTDVLTSAHDKAAPRRFSGEAITGFGDMDSRVTALLAAEDEPSMTPEERAAEDYQHFRELQAKEDRHAV